MLDTVARHCDDAEARGITGRPLLWRLARRRIVRTALRFLTVDAEFRHAFDAVPDADDLEVPFGMGGQPGVTVPLTGGRSVTFRGRIDRIDRSPDGTRVVVYDYKTGRVLHDDDLTRDPVRAGQLLQLPIYGLAAAARAGIDDAHAYYWFTRAETFEDAREGYPLDESVRARFGDVINTIADGIDAGCFPACPGPHDYDHRVHRETFENCLWCPYDRLCPVELGTAWERQSSDADMAPFWRLKLDSDAVDTAGGDR